MSLQSHRLFRSLTPVPLALALLGGVAASAGLAASEAPQIGRAAQSAKPGRTPVSYEKQIKPLLTARCYACHGNGSRLGDFQLDSRAGLLTGGKTHPVVTPGKASQSYLMRLISGQIPGKVMPARGPRLTRAEVELIGRWIDEGLDFGAGGSASSWRPTLSLSAPALPRYPGADADHPVDRILRPYFQAKRVSAAQSVSDSTFARRVYLDLIGLLPPTEELEAFLSDRSTDKRARLVDRLLGDDLRYAEHWLTFWNDLLRNDYAGTGYIDGGRAPITTWLWRALRSNLPYNRFAAELAHPTPDSAGFTKGIVWRGVVNAAQLPPMQAAQVIPQVFLGINLKCASCHDSFISNWKLSDAYGMAGVYADSPLEIVRCDKPTGKTAPVKFLYPELGAIDGAAPRENRTEQLAALLTSPRNGRFPRTLVNRLWGRMFGRALVEPVDEMDNEPWSPAVLDWLAADFVAHGYDIKHLLRQMVLTKAYQRPAVPQPTESTRQYVFRGPQVKRLTAEQFVDGVAALTDVWSSPAPGAPYVAPALESAPPSIGLNVLHAGAPLSSGAERIDVDVSGARYLHLLISPVDGEATAPQGTWGTPRLTTRAGQVRLTDLPWLAAAAERGRVFLNRNEANRPPRVDGEAPTYALSARGPSVVSYILPPGVTRFQALVGPDVRAGRESGALRFQVAVSVRPLLQTRAALSNADALTRALGRPNREQVVTTRPPVATTLQMLELTNGPTLSRMLNHGAAAWASGILGGTGTPAQLADRIYLSALSRKPTPIERAEALKLLGTDPTPTAVEDLLWSVLMLPEFQLVF